MTMKRYVQTAKMRGMMLTAMGLLFVVAGWVFVSNVGAQSTDMPQGSRLITVHDRGTDQSFVSKEATVRQALEAGGVHVEAGDTVEPGLDEELVAQEYSINIYRARPVVIVDGVSRTRVVTAAQVPSQIARDAGISLAAEDTAQFAQTEDIVSDGASLRMTVTRAVDITLTLYGKTTAAKTQAKTVGEMLVEKGVTLAADDRVSPDAATPIRPGLEVRVWREGKQTVTVEEAVAFETEKIQDANRESGYREVRTKGVDGARSVTYEIIIQDGKEVSRTEIAAVSVREPVKQVEVVGAKFNYTGGPLSDAQITALGMCESKMTPTTNSGNGFYGAFQFMASTWSSVAPAEYRGMLPHEAPLDVQKQAVQNLLSRSSIYTQFPGCAKKMSAQGIL